MTLTDGEREIERDLALTNPPGEGDALPPTPREAAIALDLPAFLAWMAQRRDGMIGQARDEYRAAPQFGEAAYPALRWHSVPGEVWARADARAWELVRQGAGMLATTPSDDMAGPGLDGLDLGGEW